MSSSFLFNPCTYCVDFKTDFQMLQNSSGVNKITLDTGLVITLSVMCMATKKN
jgi:hypothetical protein